MRISANHLKRYTEIARLFWRYGRSDLIQKMNGDGMFDLKEFKAGENGQAQPEQLASDLEGMGPTYVKLGQLLSSRSDLLPAPYLESLARLQDRVKPFPFEEVEEIILAELGARVSKAFSHFDPKPIAAASLGQVHSAALRDGRKVIVKVQRPGIRRQIAEDFEVLGQIAEFLDAHTEVGRRYHFQVVLEEFRLTIRHELNYEREAQNLVTLGGNLREFELIQVPQPVADYCTRCVLTMDYVHGRKITSIGPLSRLELNGQALTEELFKAYLKQILVDGFFHADPHPGNVFLTDDGRVALLDLGMVGHLAPGMQENLLKLLMAVSEGNSEKAVEVVVQMSKASEEFDLMEFSRRISGIMAAQQNQNLRRLSTGKALMEVSRSAVNSGLYIPGEMTLLGKTLLQLDTVGKILDPAFDPYAAIRRNVADLMSRRVKKTLTQAGVFGSLLEAKDFVARLPARLNRILDGLTNSELELKVKAVDAKMLVEGFQKIANRITAGIILASLILGASFLMQIHTRFEILGYPALAILCFLAAAGGGVWLLISIFLQDQKIRKRKM